jgi:hypothetical protein
MRGNFSVSTLIPCCSWLKPSVFLSLVLTPAKLYSNFNVLRLSFFATVLLLNFGPMQPSCGLFAVVYDFSCDRLQLLGFGAL